MSVSTLPPVELGIYIMMGISLAAVAGLRAFLPLCVVSWLASAGTIQLSDAYAWLGSDPALLVFTLAAVVEIAADKIPVLDNVLDHAADFIKPVAGTILVSSFITEWNPLVATVFGILAGGSVASIFHQAKKITRLASTGVTLGLGNSAISVGEDVAGGFGIAMALLIPAVAFAFVMIAGYVLYKGSQRIYRWFRMKPAPPTPPGSMAPT